MTTEIQSPQPLSDKIVEMYLALLSKDRKEVKEAYMVKFGVKDKSFLNLIANREVWKPSYEERMLITEEVMKRYYASTNPEQIEAFIEAKVKAGMAVVEPKSLYQTWKDKKLGKKATTKQDY